MNDKLNVLHSYNEILFSHKKGMTHATVWMSFENLRPRERNQTQKTTYCLVSFI